MLLAVANTLESLRASRSPLSCGLLLLVPYMHVINGCGLLFGLLTGKLERKDSADIIITRIKRFDQNL
jgi:hypothetical protein